MYHHQAIEIYKMENSLKIVIPIKMMRFRETSDLPSSSKQGQNKSPSCWLTVAL